MMSRIERNKKRNIIRSNRKSESDLFRPGFSFTQDIFGFKSIGNLT